ncbi:MULTISPECIES: DUF3566 domain-containing protein [unclassified Rathayibacter]|uniref:DUF3566 domain-containing protein n=1 Tax=unclassified Rathayibacter TaxID=2609250 RepID=UPI000CE8CA98|nr:MULTISPECIES: DUF3566 domain-containing protein [unclassified Rathayibacter]PPF27846.1 hypothetical protein C5C54_08300 [Rathayibacter sp. AY1F2]PPH11241.1 hypothetical protein C5C71_07225 [Rathayibacter sp. AY1C1]PPH20600.1 hypothetical protein C5C99_08630 [Rathayibacter sp. AY1C4]PPH27695.1 hypothetical protein C5C37_12695 [Rathayibacter sp. AY1F9]PPH44518.1 hypothetical protein C5D09_13070 [Rathayibacter sp. AY1C9]
MTGSGKPAGDQAPLRLALVHVDFWSAVKLSFLLGLALAILGLVAVLVAHPLLVHSDLFTQADTLLGQVVGDQIDLDAILSLPNVLGFALVGAVLNTVVATALGGVGALLFGSAAALAGGLPVGLARQ